MKLHPDNKPTPTPIDMARECLTEALAPHFKGKMAEERLTEAVSDALGSIEHLITIKDVVKKKPLGATIMTEQASGNIRPGISPRNV